MIIFISASCRKAVGFLAILCMILSPLMSTARAGYALRGRAQTGEMLAQLEFDPAVHGYGFQNYGNDPPRHWQSDLGAEDLIRMFGPAAVCKSGTTAKDCVMNASAHTWMMKELKGMNIGHCEGMAVTCLRMDVGLPFKSFSGPSSFQSSAKNTFGLKLDEHLSNYIAYYFVTQSFREVAKATKATGAQGPVAVVKMLIDAINSGNDTYTLGIYKCEDCEKPDGHAITPFAVEDAGTMYRIHVYDNNFPGKTGFVTVEKGGNQTWKYTTAQNPGEPPELYTGNIDTATLELTPTAAREGKCFEAPFARNDAKATGCGLDTAKPSSPSAKPKPAAAPVGPAPKPPPTMADEGEDADFFLTGPGDMMIIDGDGKKVGFDPETGKYYDEIADAEVQYTSGGRGIDTPHFILPYDAETKPYTVIFSGRNLKKASVMDFAYSGPGFTVGLDGIKLDPGEMMAATISPDGEKIGMAMTKDGEMPEVFYSIDTPKKSYSTVVKGKGFAQPKNPAPQKITGLLNSVTAGLNMNMAGFIAAVAAAKKTKGNVPPAMMIDFQDANKLEIADSIDGDGRYDVDLEQFDAAGKKDKIQLKDIGKSDDADAYEIEVGEWNGGKKIAVKHDDEGNGFDDDEEVMDEDEPNDITDDPDKDGGALMSFIYRSIGW